MSDEPEETPEVAEEEEVVVEEPAEEFAPEPEVPAPVAVPEPAPPEVKEPRKKSDSSKPVLETAEEETLPEKAKCGPRRGCCKPCPARKKRKVSYVWAPPKQSAKIDKFEPCPHIFFKNKNQLVKRDGLSRDDHRQLIASPNKTPWVKPVPKANKLLRYRKRPLPDRYGFLSTPRKGYVKANWEEFKDFLSPQMTERLIKLLGEDFELSLEEANKVVKTGKKPKKKRRHRRRHRLTSAEREEQEREEREGWVKCLLGHMSDRAADIAESRPNKRFEMMAVTVLERLLALAGDDAPVLEPDAPDKLPRLMILVAEQLAGWMEGVIHEADGWPKQKPPERKSIEGEPLEGDVEEFLPEIEPETIVEGVLEADTENPIENGSQTEQKPESDLPEEPVIPVRYRIGSFDMPCGLPCIHEKKSKKKHRSKSKGKKALKEEVPPAPPVQEEIPPVEDECCYLPCGTCGYAPRRKSSKKRSKSRHRSKSKRAKKLKEKVEPVEEETSPGDEDDDCRCACECEPIPESRHGKKKKKGKKGKKEKPDGDKASKEKEGDGEGEEGEGEGEGEEEEAGQGDEDVEAPAEEEEPGEEVGDQGDDGGGEPSEEAEDVDEKPSASSKPSSQRATPKSSANSKPSSQKTTPKDSAEKKPSASSKPSSQKTTPKDSAEKKPSASSKPSSQKTTPKDSAEKKPSASSKPSSEKPSPKSSAEKKTPSKTSPKISEEKPPEEPIEEEPEEEPAAEEPAPEEPAPEEEPVVEEPVEEPVLETTAEDEEGGEEEDLDAAIEEAGEQLADEALEEGMLEADEAEPTDAKVTFGTLLGQLSQMIEDLPENEKTERRNKLTKTLEKKFSRLIESESPDGVDDGTREVITTVADKIANWMEGVIDEAESRIKILTSQDELGAPSKKVPSTVTSTNVKEWAEWIVGAMTVADDWASWISKTVADAELKAAKKKGKAMTPEGTVDKLTRQEWTTWKDGVKRDVIDFRMKKKDIAETAYNWNTRTKGKRVVHGQPGTSNADDMADLEEEQKVTDMDEEPVVTSSEAPQAFEEPPSDEPPAEEPPAEEPPAEEPPAEEPPAEDPPAEEPPAEEPPAEEPAA